MVLAHFEHIAARLVLSADDSPMVLAVFILINRHLLSDEKTPARTRPGFKAFGSVAKHEQACDAAILPEWHLLHGQVEAYALPVLEAGPPCKGLKV